MKRPGLTIMLSLSAGFCDAITFSTVGEFSAHITGNLVVFAYDLARGADWGAFLKLITLPVFVVTVIIGAWMDTQPGRKRLLFLESGLLIGAGLVALFFRDDPTGWGANVSALLIVSAMGLQNIFSKLNEAELHGPTTAMTGNTTIAALDFVGWIFLKQASKRSSLGGKLMLIGGFVAGCILGALTGLFIGLPGAGLLGVALLGYTLLRNGYHGHSTLPSS